MTMVGEDKMKEKWDQKVIIKCEEELWKIMLKKDSN